MEQKQTEQYASALTLRNKIQEAVVQLGFIGIKTGTVGFPRYKNFEKYQTTYSIKKLSISSVNPQLKILIRLKQTILASNKTTMFSVLQITTLLCPRRAQNLQRFLCTNLSTSTQQAIRQVQSAHHITYLQTKQLQFFLTTMQKGFVLTNAH